MSGDIGLLTVCEQELLYVFARLVSISSNILSEYAERQCRLTRSLETVNKAIVAFYTDRQWTLFGQDIMLLTFNGQ